MSHSTRFQVVAVLVVGALLGYAVASRAVPSPTLASQNLTVASSLVATTESYNDGLARCSNSAARNLRLAQTMVAEAGFGSQFHLVAQANAKTAQSTAQKSGKAANSASRKPNILVIWGDDIGQGRTEGVASPLTFFVPAARLLRAAGGL